MNSVRTTHSLSAEEHTSVDRSLLEYLKPKAEERYSRIEAYCDLLARASNSPYTAKCAGQQIDLLPGQCVLTISDLARKWQWQRATVRQFLDGLVALGLLEMKPFVKSYVFTIRPHSSLSLTVSSTDDLLDFCHLLFARYILGRTSPDEVADSFGTFYGMMADHASGQQDDDAAKSSVSQHQIQQFHRLMTFMAFQTTAIHNMPVNIQDAVRLLFGRDRQWNWHDVIADLGFLASAFRLHTKPSLLTEAKTVHGEVELSLLDSICDSYLSAFPAIASNDGCDTSSMAHGDAIKSQHEDLPDTNTKTSKAVPKTTGASPEDETPTSVGTEG